MFERGTHHRASIFFHSALSIRRSGKLEPKALPSRRRLLRHRELCQIFHLAAATKNVFQGIVLSSWREQSFGGSRKTKMHRRSMTISAMPESEPLNLNSVVHCPTKAPPPKIMETPELTNIPQPLGVYRAVRYLTATSFSTSTCTPTLIGTLQYWGLITHRTTLQFPTSRRTMFQSLPPPPVTMLLTMRLSWSAL